MGGKKRWMSMPAAVAAVLAVGAAGAVAAAAGFPAGSGAPPGAHAGCWGPGVNGSDVDGAAGDGLLVSGPGDWADNGGCGGQMIHDPQD
jgi:hypothetical protein